MEEPKYKRVLLKISGEALAGDASRGLDFDVIGGVCDVIKRCVQLGVQVGIVVGGVVAAVIVPIYQSYGTIGGSSGAI